MNHQQSFLDLMPTFTSGVNTLHNLLVNVAFVLCFAGMMIIGVRATQERNLSDIFNGMVRLGLIAIMCGSLGGWANQLQDLSNDLLQEIGWTGPSGGIMAEYKHAVAAKWGSDGVADKNQSTGWNPFGWIQRLTDATTETLEYPFVYLLNLIAMAIMWLMAAAQQILLAVSIAVSPIFLGMLMLPALRHIATRFFLSLVSLCIWPLGWSVADLLTRLLVDWAVNPSTAAGTTAGLFGGSAGATGPDSGEVAATVAAFSGIPSLGLFVILAVWVIGSSIVAPIIVSKAIMGNGDSGAQSVARTVFGTTAAFAMFHGSNAARAISRSCGSGGGQSVAVHRSNGSNPPAFKNFASRGIKPPTTPV